MFSRQSADTLFWLDSHSDLFSDPTGECVVVKEHKTEQMNSPCREWNKSYDRGRRRIISEQLEAAEWVVWS